MFIVFIASAFVVLLMSLGIALASRHFDLRGDTLSGHLFGHNNAYLATFSNIGSVLCLTLAIGAVVPAVAGWGFTPIYTTCLATCLAFPACQWLIRRIRRANRSRGFTSATAMRSLIDLVGEHDRADLLAMILGLYACVLVLELAMARLFLQAVFFGSPLQAIMTVGAICFLCATYTSVAGFIGVLRTDLFQLLIVFATCIALIVLPRVRFDTIFPALGHSFVSENLLPRDPILILVNIVIVFCYFSCFPDFWIRNVGTLKPQHSLQRVFPFSTCGILLMLIPSFMLGLDWLGQKTQVTRHVDCGDSFIYLQHLVHAFLTSEQQRPGLTWLLCGSIVCILVTTLDTWLIGIVQHLSISKPDLNHHQLRLVPFCAILLAFLTSLCVGENGYYVLGIITGIPYFGTLIVIASAALTGRNTIPVRKYLRVYLGLTITLTIGELAYWRGNISQGVTKIMALQIVLAVLVATVMYCIQRRKPSSE